MSVEEDLQDEYADLIEDDVLGPSVVVEQQEVHRLIQEMIDNLSDTQRACIMLHYYADMSVKEIAETQECSEGTVKSRLNYARKQLKEGILKLEEKHKTRLYSVAPITLFISVIKNIPNEYMLSEREFESIWKGISTSIGSAIAVGKATIAKKTGEKFLKRVALHSTKSKVVVGISTITLVATTSLIVHKTTIEFKDPVVESGIRKMLNITNKKLQPKDLDTINTISIIGDYWDMTGENYAIDYINDKEIYIKDENDNRVNICELDTDELSKYNLVKLGDVKSLVDLANLKNLSFVHLQFLNELDISDYEELNNLPSLSSVQIEFGKSISRLPDLSHLKNLETLGYEVIGNIECEAVDISNLSKMTDVEWLMLYVHNIKDTSCISDMKNLEHLFMGTDTKIDANDLLKLSKLEGGCIVNKEPIIDCKLLEDKYTWENLQFNFSKNHPDYFLNRTGCGGFTNFELDSEFCRDVEAKIWG